MCKVGRSGMSAEGNAGTRLGRQGTARAPLPPVHNKLGTEQLPSNSHNKVIMQAAGTTLTACILTSAGRLTVAA